jgi:hypothetical protein
LRGIAAILALLTGLGIQRQLPRLHFAIVFFLARTDNSIDSAGVPAGVRLDAAKDEDALRATDITEPIVLVLHQLANQFGTVGAEPGNDIIDVFDWVAPPEKAP